MKPRPADDPTALRRAAEARRSARPASAPTNEADLRRLQHELEVHQTELELQNEQLLAARAELEAGLERYTDLYDHAPVGYFSLQADGTIHLVNLTGARLLGRERAHLLGRRLGLFVAESARPAFSDFLATAFATETRPEAELELSIKGQPPRWVRVDGAVTADRQECRVTAVDITERRQAEAAQREVAACLSATLDALPAHIALLDPQGVILSVNQAWQHFATANGLSDGSFGVGRNYLSLCDSAIGGCSDEAQAVAAGIRSVLQGRAKEFALAYPCHSPTEQRWFRLTATAVHTGTQSGAVVMHVNITDRKLIESKLLLADRVLKNVSQGVIVTGSDQMIVTVNAAFTAITGYSEPETLGRNCKFLQGTGTDPVTVAAIRQALGDGKGFSGEILNYRKDGTPFWNEMTISPVRDPRGVLTHFIGLTRDITSRRQAADALALTTQLLERTGELANVGGWSVDLPTMKPSWTRETFRIAEIEPPIEPPLAEGINLFAPEARPIIAAAVQAAMDTGTPYDLELPIITARGRHRWVRTQGFGEMRDGKTVRIYGTFQDITARREAEALLRASEVRLERTLDGAHIGHWELDLVTHAARRSLQHDQIFGYEELLPEWTYEKFLTHVLPEDRAEVDRSFRAGVAAKTEWEFECRITRRDGAQRWIWAHGNVLTNALGETVQVVGVVRDITASKEVEAALRASESRTRFLVRAANVGLWDWDLATGSLYFSPEWKAQLGYADHEVSSRFEEWESRLHPEDRAATLAAVAEFQAGSHLTYDVEFRLRHRDGSWRWILAQAEIARDAGGRAVRMTGSHIDITARKQADDALRKRTAFLEAMINSSSDGILVVDPQKNRLHQNAQMAELYGIPRGIAEHPDYEAQLEFASNRAKNPQEFRERVAYWYANPQEAGRDEIELVDGTFVERTSAPVLGKDGELFGRIWNFRDVTPRKRAEAALRASEARSRAIVEASPVPMALNDADLNILFVNPAFTQAFGYELGDILTLRDWWPKAYPDLVYRQWVAEAWENELARASQTGTDFAPLDLRIRCKDGTERIVMVSAAPLEDAFAGAHLVVLNDITERKRAEATLRENQHLLEQAQLVGHIGTWISEVGPPARLVWSAETCRIFGVAPGAFDGRPETFIALVHPEDRAGVARARQAAQAGGPAYDLEHRIVRPDGQERWVHEQAGLERDPAGRILRRVGVVQDITERKHLEHQLRHAQKMEAIGQLAGGIAHDFNNILGSILGNTELIRVLPPGGPEAGGCLDDILTASRRAAELVGQILAFSRRQESRRLPIQLQPVVREALSLLRATVPAQVVFRPRLASVPSVLADPTELHSVIMNLCTNAWHALLGQGGLITVELAEVEPEEDFIRLHRDLRPGRYVCLTVADDGCGMDEATLARIFEPFFTTKPVGVGTGLGLSVVHGIMKNHDGAIVVQSRPGAGSTFQLYFPVFAAEAPAAAPPPKPAPRGAGQHILFVDDEEPLARLGTRALERLGYRVTPHTDPAEALAAFRARPTDFDLVVVDYNMPGLNGTEFGAQVLEVRPVQRIILTTGFSASLTPEAVCELGFRELMPKPYDLNRLGETVHRALHGNDAQP